MFNSGITLLRLLILKPYPAGRHIIPLMSDPEGPDIECFVVFLDFHFNSNKRITGANQNSRLGTYNKHKANSQNHRMSDLQSTFLILFASFSSTSCFFSSGITLKIVAF